MSCSAKNELDTRRVELRRLPLGDVAEAELNDRCTLGLPTVDIEDTDRRRLEAVGEV